MPLIKKWLITIALSLVAMNICNDYDECHDCTENSEREEYYEEAIELLKEKSRRPKF